ncbi:hypothetical protein PLESTF_000733500 [Pleodorina starrii]|nr:hypothetical protein PLESTF_000733500 [Pleodorina starrii]
MARSLRKKPRRAWWKYLASVLCAALMVFATLRYLAVNELGDHLGTAAKALDHVDDFALLATHDQPASAPSPAPSPVLQPEAAGLDSDTLRRPSISSTEAEQLTSVSPQPTTDETAPRETAMEVGPSLQVADAERLTVTRLLDFTPLSACALDLVFQCNEHEPAPQIKQTSGSECNPVAADNPVVAEFVEPTQELPPSNPTLDVTGSSYTVMAMASVITVILSAATLIYVAKRLGFAFVFTDNVGTAAHGEPECAGQYADVTVDAVEPTAAILQAEAEHQHDDAIDVSAATEVQARVVPVQQQTEADFQSAECTRDVDARFDVVHSVSPLLCAPLFSTAKSQHNLPDSDPTLDRFRSPAPLAMAMLTPTEPPSPFPGFPALSSFASQRSSDDTAPGAKPAQSTSQPSGSSETGGAGADDSQATWSSAPSPDAGDVTSNNSELPSHALAAPAPTSPGVAPWRIVYPLATETPDSSSASFANDGHIQPQSMEAASAIFDLSHFDEDGEVISISSLAPKLEDADDCSDNLHAAETADDYGITFGLQRRQAKKQLSQAKAAVSDVRASDVASATAINSSGGSDAAATPSWPPKLNSGVAAPSKPVGLGDAQGPAGAALGAALDDIDQDLISYEALSLSRTLVCGLASGRAPSSPGADEDSLRKTCQEPGREHAAVAAATTVLLSGFKASSKSVLLAACAGDEPTLRRAQGDLYAAVAQLLDMDLAPHSYTTSSAACKALAYSNAVTPVSGVPFTGFGSAGLSQDIAGSGGGSWASIGSRVASGPVAADASSTLGGGSAALPLAPRALSSSAPLATPSSGSASVIADDAGWPDGPLRPLPNDIDSYLAARRKGTASPSAHVLAGLQDCLAYAGLLVNATASQVAFSRAELLEHVISAREEASAWRQRAFDAEARLAAVEEEVVPDDGCSEEEGIDGLHVEHLGSDRGENVWVCVDLPSTQAAAALEDVAVPERKSATTAPLTNEASASVSGLKTAAPASDTTFHEGQPSATETVVRAEVSEVVRELVSSVIKGLVQRQDEVLQRDEIEARANSMAAGSPARVLASDVTVAAREDMFGFSSPTSIRSGSGSCAAADRTPEPAPHGPYTGSGGMGSRIGPLVSSSPTEPSFAARLENMFHASWGLDGAQWSPASPASGLMSNLNNGEGDDDGESSCCSSARRLWRPPRVSFS